MATSRPFLIHNGKNIWILSIQFWNLLNSLVVVPISTHTLESCIPDLLPCPCLSEMRNKQVMTYGQNAGNRSRKGYTCTDIGQ